MKKIMYCGICCLIACQGLQALKDNEAAKDNTVVTMANTSPVAENDDGCIDLSGRKLDDRGLEEFCETLKWNQEIKRLDLSNNEITDRGLARLLCYCHEWTCLGGKYLMDGLCREVQIDELVIDNNPIKNAGGTMLVAAYNDRLLQGRVSAQGCGINRIILKDLEELSQLGGKFVDTGRFVSNMGEPGVRRLKSIDIYGREIDAQYLSVKDMLLRELGTKSIQGGPAWKYVWGYVFWFYRYVDSCDNFEAWYKEFDWYKEFEDWYKDTLADLGEQDEAHQKPSDDSPYASIIDAFKATKECLLNKGIEIRELEKKKKAVEKEQHMKEQVSKEAWDALQWKIDEQKDKYHTLSELVCFVERKWGHQDYNAKSAGSGINIIHTGWDETCGNIDLEDDKCIDRVLGRCRTAPCTYILMHGIVLTDVGVGELVNTQQFKDSDIILDIRNNPISTEMYKAVSALNRATRTMIESKKEIARSLRMITTLKGKLENMRQERLEQLGDADLVLQKLGEFDDVENMSKSQIESKLEECRKVFPMRAKRRFPPIEESLSSEEKISKWLNSLLGNKLREMSNREKCDQACEKKCAIIADINILYIRALKLSQWENDMQEYENQLKEIRGAGKNEEEKDINKAIAAMQEKRAEIDRESLQVVEKYRK